MAIENPDEVRDRYTDWYGFDTENDEKGKVTLACLVHESGECWIWKKAGNFAKWCDSQPEGSKPVVICHNLEYDLVNEFGPRYPYLQLNYLKGNLISAKCGRVTFLDSFNHFRMSLKAIGECLGIKKLDMDIYSEEYVKQDAWISLQVMVQARDYIASIGGRIGATSGSSAISIWKFMTDSEFCYGALDTPWLRRGYYGGRTEIFRALAEGDIRGYDINSMYPYAMIDEYPEYSMSDPRMDKSKGMAEVTIEIPTDLFVAPLPYRDPNGRLIYPTGVIRGVWTYDEIRRAEKMGATIQHVHKANGCNVLVRPFDDFIYKLYAKRKETKVESERLFLKVMMNSLYGKIAARSTITRTVSRYTLLQNNSRRIDEVRWIDGHRGLLDYTTPPQDHVNLIWGSMITANARLLLMNYLTKCPPEKLIYCDTDSMYCLDHDLPCGPELGQMKLEKQAKLMKVVQPKAYQIDDFYRAKGVPKPKLDANGNIEINYAKNYIDDRYAEFNLPIRFRASLTSKRGVANQWVKCHKRRKTDYEHKPFHNGRYYPPVIGNPGQTEMFSLGEVESKKKRVTNKNKNQKVNR